MFKIECLVCGQDIRLPEYIDLDNYDGQLICRQCGSLFHVILVESKVRKYEIVEKGHGISSQVSVITERGQEAGLTQELQPVQEVDVERVALYNPLRDYLATYVASTIRLTFDQIEDIIKQKLETGAYTLESWWENDMSHPQAIAWMQAGWRVFDVNFPQRVVTLLRM